jgi:GH43 family beta-xylosidase
MMTHRSTAAAGAAALLLAAACAGRAPGAPGAPASPPAARASAACTFTNPLAPGADPWVVRHGGAYYLVQSRRGGIWVSRSDKLTQIADTTGRAARSARVWTAPDTGWNHANVWAPELHRIDGRWYIYYTAGRRGPQDAPFIYQRSGVLQSTGDDPMGPYVDRGKLYTGDHVAADTGDVWSIDLTVGRIRGQLYAVWSGWERNTEIALTPQHLYIARMANPWTIASNRAKLSSPTAPWERREDQVKGLDLQEGPELLERDSTLFIIYSTRESWLPAYRLGQLRLKSPTSDPMDSASYVKTGPVFAPANGVYGVGHNGFTTSPDGTEDWIVYHAKTDTAPGWRRVIRMQKYTWDPDGSPRFGAPAPSGQPLPVPSGECR